MLNLESIARPTGMTAFTCAAHAHTYFDDAQAHPKGLTLQIRPSTQATKVGVCQKAPATHPQ